MVNYEEMIDNLGEYVEEKISNIEKTTNKKAEEIALVTRYFESGEATIKDQYVLISAFNQYYEVLEPVIKKAKKWKKGK